MREGIGMEKGLVVSEKRLPPPVADYRPGDVAGMAAMVPDIINSAALQWDCERILGSAKCLQGALNCPGVSGGHNYLCTRCEKWQLFQRVR